MSIGRHLCQSVGLAGLRIGHAVACPVRAMYEVNNFAVAFTERMLRLSDEIRASVRRLNEGRDGFVRAMKELDFRTFRTRGNFRQVAFGERALALHEALKNLVLYCRCFGEPCLEGFSRFSSAPPKVFQPVIDRIRQVVHRHGAGVP